MGGLLENRSDIVACFYIGLSNAEDVLGGLVKVGRAKTKNNVGFASRWRDRLVTP
jgi:hypothetical protein